MGKWKKTQKFEKHDFGIKKLLTITFMPLSSSVNLIVSYFFRNEEKLVALLVYSSFRRVATSGIRNRSVATSSINWI